jgi:hydroxymethylpyrimidine pyrophosphatase-like HAD family hydrolase
VSNGAVERAMDGSTFVRRLLDKDTARQVLAATRRHRHAAALIFDRDLDRQVIYETMDWDHPGRQRYWSRNHSHIAQSIPLEDALVEDPIQVMYNGGVDDMRALFEWLRAEVDGCAIQMTEYVHRDFTLVDVTSPEATKGRALAWRAEQLGLSRDEVMAIGDNFNDVEMLEFAGHPVLMDNAVESLKSRGWQVTGHQDQAGVAQAIERFVLRR